MKQNKIGQGYDIKIFVIFIMFHVRIIIFLGSKNERKMRKIVPDRPRAKPCYENNIVAFVFFSPPRRNTFQRRYDICFFIIIIITITIIIVHGTRSMVLTIRRSGKRKDRTKKVYLLVRYYDANFVRAYARFFSYT